MCAWTGTSMHEAEHIAPQHPRPLVPPRTSTATNRTKDATARTRIATKATPQKHFNAAHHGATPRNGTKRPDTVCVGRNTTTNSHTDPWWHHARDSHAFLGVP